MKMSSKQFYFSVLFTLCFMLSFLFLNMRGMERFMESSDETTLQSMEEAVRRAAVQCYALEGGYPPNIAYLKDHYGIVVNEKDYFYFYEVTASNIMPEIKVIKK